MNLDFIKTFFADYTVQSIIIACVIMVAKILVEKYYKDKIPSFVLTFVPFLTVIILDLIVNMIIVEKAFIITESSIYSAFLSAVLSTILTALARRILKGKDITLDKNQLFLEEILNVYDQDGSKNLANLIKPVLDDDNLDEIIKEQEITIILKEKLEHLTELEISSVSKIILQSVNKN